MIICSNLENRVLNTNTIKPNPFLGNKHFCEKKRKENDLTFPGILGVLTKCSYIFKMKEHQ